MSWSHALKTCLTRAWDAGIRFAGKDTDGAEALDDYVQTAAAPGIALASHVGDEFGLEFGGAGRFPSEAGLPPRAPNTCCFLKITCCVLNVPLACCEHENRDIPSAFSCDNFKA